MDAPLTTQPPAPSQAVPANPARAARWLAGILVLALALRLILFLSLVRTPQAFLQSDAGSYDQLAANLVSRGVFSDLDRPPYTPDAFRTPLYPLFLAGIYWVAGRSYAAVVLVQCLLSLATVYLVYRLGRLVSGVTAGLAAALIAACDAGQIIHANLLLTETLYTFLLVSALLPLWWLVSGGRLRLAVVVGLLLGLGTLCRPVAIYLPIALAAFVTLALAASLRRRAAAAGLLLLAYGLTLAPWLARNWLTFDTPGLTSIQGYNLLFFNAGYLRAQLEHKTLEQADAELQTEVQPALAAAGDNPFRQEAVYQSYGLSLIRQHPLLYARLHAQGAVLMLVLPNTNFLANMLGILTTSTGLIADLRTRGLLENIRALGQFYRDYLSRSPHLLLFLAALVLEVAGLLAAYLLDLAGLWAWLRARRWAALGLLLVPMAYFVAVTGPVGYGRYRIPIMPLVAVLAGVGAAALRQRWSRRAARSRAALS